MKHIEKWLQENGYIEREGTPATYQKGSGGNQIIWIKLNKMKYEVTLIQIQPYVMRYYEVKVPNYHRVIKILKGELK